MNDTPLNLTINKVLPLGRESTLYPIMHSFMSLRRLLYITTSILQDLASDEIETLTRIAEATTSNVSFLRAYWSCACCNPRRQFMCPTWDCSNYYLIIT